MDLSNRSPIVKYGSTTYMYFSLNKTTIRFFKTPPENENTFGAVTIENIGSNSHKSSNKRKIFVKRKSIVLPVKMY